MSRCLLQQVRFQSPFKTINRVTSNRFLSRSQRHCGIRTGTEVNKLDLLRRTKVRIGIQVAKPSRLGTMLDVCKQVVPVLGRFCLLDMCAVHTRPEQLLQRHKKLSDAAAKLFSSSSLAQSANLRRLQWIKGNDQSKHAQHSQHFISFYRTLW